MERPSVQFNPVTKAKNSYAWETRSRVKSLQFFLPIVSFLIFMFLPAGKKLFIITALIFSMFYMIIKAIRRKFIEMNPAPVEVSPEPVASSVPVDSAHH